MSEPCAVCGARNLVEARFPGESEVVAILCVACGSPQPVQVKTAD